MSQLSNLERDCANCKQTVKIDYSRRKSKQVFCSRFCRRKFKRTPVFPISGEVWKECPLISGYWISNLGRLKDLDNYLVTCTPGKRGYPVYRNKLERMLTIHQLVARAFLPNPLNKPQVNHINGVKTDNRVENLEWCTAKENNDHARRTGLNKPITKPSFLTQRHIDLIRSLKNRIPNLTCAELAPLFGVTKGAIQKIVNYQRWA